MKLTIEEVNWIHQNEYKVHPNFTLDDQAMLLIDNLGSPNSELREKSLTCLGGSIERSYYSNEQLLTMADKLEKNLLLGLGEKNTDSVFLRSFSVLILGDIIGFDQECALGRIEGKLPFLTEDKVSSYLETSLKYYNGEKDVRGYIPIKEWAHSIAHGADIFRKLAQHRFLNKKDLKKILDAFQAKIIEPQEDIYKAREELRMTVAVYTVFLRRLLSTEEIINWLEKFDNFSKDKKWYNFTEDPSWINAQLNLRMFLTCLYLMVKNGIINTGYFGTPFYQNNLLEDRNSIIALVESLLMNIDKGIYYTQ